MYHSTVAAKASFLSAVSGVEPNEANGKQKLVVISGCDRGFGFLLAKALVEETDYLILALALTAEGVETLKAMANKTSRLFTLRCNITSQEDVANTAVTVQAILSEQDAILYSIVNNAGMASAGDFLFYPDVTIYETVMAVNFLGHVRLTRALMGAMLKTSRELTAKHAARILNISSVCGVVASASNSSYNASKFALEGWSDCIRLELEPFNIHVVKIRPGTVLTKIQKDWPETFKENFRKSPQDIQDLYGGQAFLESCQAVMDAADVESNASPPEIVVECLVELLSIPAQKLHPDYFVGMDARTFFRALSIVPTKIADSIKRLIRFKYPVHEKAK
jgi:NAD(P)-dependent dehydrogenase (short-subunit alcohol dehydrogenase family)